MTSTTSRLSRPGLPMIERASPADHALLAMDSGAVPEQFGVILLLDQAARFDLPSRFWSVRQNRVFVTRSQRRRPVTFGSTCRAYGVGLMGDPDRGNGMARIEGEIVIGRPVDVVFDYVADQSNEPQYNPRMVRAEKITAGPVGKGT